MAKQKETQARTIFSKHYSRNSDSGYFNIHQVKQKVDNYNTLINSFSNKDSSIIQGIIQQLRILLNTVRTQENNFYSRFSISEKEHNVFYDRIEQWRISMNHLLDKNTAQDVCNIMSSVISDEDVHQALQTYLDQPTDPLVNSTILTNNLAQFLNEEFNIDKHRFSQSFSDGINASFYVTKKTNGKYEVKQKTGSDSKLSNYMKLKIIRTVNKGLEEENRIATSLTEEITEQIYNRLAIGVSDIKMLMCLRDELIKRKNEYTKFPHLPVVQGWLGEIYWNAAFSYITNSRMISIPTGSMRNKSGQQLSVDMIYKDAGFQIKNWTFNEQGEKIINKKMNLGNFLSDKAVLLESYVGQVIAQMFGAASYNKPNEQYKNEHFDEYKQVYEDLKQLTTQLEPLTKIFYTQLNKIIEIDNGNELKELLPTGTNIYYNTFWLLKDKIVPSSVIIEQLIEDIESNFSTIGNGIRFSILSITEKEEKMVWPLETNFTDRAMANRWSINYEYIFNLENLLSKAAYKI